MGVDAHGAEAAEAEAMEVEGERGGKGGIQEEGGLQEWLGEGGEMSSHQQQERQWQQVLDELTEAKVSVSHASLSCVCVCVFCEPSLKPRLLFHTEARALIYTLTLTNKHIHALHTSTLANKHHHTNIHTTGALQRAVCAGQDLSEGPDCGCEAPTVCGGAGRLISLDDAHEACFKE